MSMEDSPTKFDNSRGDYHTRDFSQPLMANSSDKPKGASKYWPNYHCVNSCGFNVTPESANVRCPNCGTKLVRYILTQYDEKGSKSERNAR